MRACLLFDFQIIWQNSFGLTDIFHSIFRKSTKTFILYNFFVYMSNESRNSTYNKETFRKAEVKTHIRNNSTHRAIHIQRKFFRSNAIEDFSDFFRKDTILPINFCFFGNFEERFTAWIVRQNFMSVTRNAKFLCFEFCNERTHILLDFMFLEEFCRVFDSAAMQFSHCKNSTRKRCMQAIAG